MNMMSFKTNKSIQRDNEDTLQQENKEHNGLRLVIFQTQTCFWKIRPAAACWLFSISPHCNISFANLSRSVVLICYGTSMMLKHHIRYNENP